MIKANQPPTSLLTSFSFETLYTQSNERNDRTVFYRVRSSVAYMYDKVWKSVWNARQCLERVTITNFVMISLCQLLISLWFLYVNYLFRYDFFMSITYFVMISLCQLFIFYCITLRGALRKPMVQGISDYAVWHHVSAFFVMSIRFTIHSFERYLSNLERYILKTVREI